MQLLILMMIIVLAGANNSGKTSLIELFKEFLKIKKFQKRIFQQSTTQNYSITLYPV